MPVFLVSQPTNTGPGGHRANRPQPLTRDQLLSLGMTQAQVDHEMVRRHELEVIEQSFTRWVMAFGCVICMLLPVNIGLLIFLCYGYVVDREKDCDVPLSVWFVVVVSSIVYHFNFNGRSIHRQVVRLFCRYEAIPPHPEPVPMRVRLFTFVLTSFNFLWHCIGLHWVRIGKTCSETAPNLYRSSWAYSAFYLFFTVFTTISTFGLSRLLASLMRRGMLPLIMVHPDRAAPKGTLEQQQTVAFNTADFADDCKCPTCLDEFSDDKVIKRTVCGHRFHEECLVPWLRVNRTCPLCRTDLARDIESSGGATTVVDSPLDDMVPGAVVVGASSSSVTNGAVEDLEQASTAARRSAETPGGVTGADSGDSHPLALSANSSRPEQVPIDPTLALGLSPLVSGFTSKAGEVSPLSCTGTGAALPNSSDRLWEERPSPENMDASYLQTAVDASAFGDSGLDTHGVSGAPLLPCVVVDTQVAEPGREDQQHSDSASGGAMEVV